MLVGRDRLLARMVHDVEDAIDAGAGHAWLLIGPRGSGKTHVLAALYHRIRRRVDLRDRVAIAYLKEHEPQVTSVLDWLLAILRSFVRHAEGPGGLEPELQRLRSLPAPAAEREAVHVLLRFVGDRQLLLLAEDLGTTFARLGRPGQQRFRDLVQQYPLWTIVATTQALFEDVQTREAPFYGFFKIQHLAPLTLEEAIELFDRLAELEDRDDLRDFFASPAGRGRIRAIVELAQGNPRLLVMFYQIVERHSVMALADAFVALIEELTVYYREMRRGLPPIQNKILDYLCERRAPVPVKDIARDCFLSSQTASKELEKLRKRRFVQSIKTGRMSCYEVREPLMRLSAEARAHVGHPSRLFVDFLGRFYSSEELKRKHRATSVLMALNEAPRRTLEHERDVVAAALTRHYPDRSSSAALRDAATTSQADMLADVLEIVGTLVAAGDHREAARLASASLGLALDLPPQTLEAPLDAPLDGGATSDDAQRNRAHDALGRLESETNEPRVKRALRAYQRHLARTLAERYATPSLALAELEARALAGFIEEVRERSGVLLGELIESWQGEPQAAPFVTIARRYPEVIARRVVVKLLRSRNRSAVGVVSLAVLFELAGELSEASATDDQARRIGRTIVGRQEGLLRSLYGRGLSDEAPADEAPADEALLAACREPLAELLPNASEAELAVALARVVAVVNSRVVGFDGMNVRTGRHAKARTWLWPILREAVGRTGPMAGSPSAAPGRPSDGGLERARAVGDALTVCREVLGLEGLPGPTEEPSALESPQAWGRIWVDWRLWGWRPKQLLERWRRVLIKYESHPGLRARRSAAAERRAVAWLRQRLRRYEQTVVEPHVAARDLVAAIGKSRPGPSHASVWNHLPSSPQRGIGAALAESRERLAETPGDPAHLAELAWLEAHHGSADAAQELAGQAIAELRRLRREAGGVEGLSAALAVVWRVLADALAGIRLIDEARRSYEEATALTPHASAPWVEWATMERLQGEPERAISLMRRALTHTPGEVWLTIGLGDALLDAGQAQAAVSAYTEAARAQPMAADAHLRIVLAHAREADWDAAVEALRRALAVAPDQGWLAWEDALALALDRLHAIALANAPTERLARLLAEILAVCRNGPYAESYRTGVTGALTELLRDAAAQSPRRLAVVRDAVLTAYQGAEGLAVACRWLDIAVRHLERHDQRVLLELPLEERRQLEGLLNGTDGAASEVP